jgi:hypothetical protein
MLLHTSFTLGRILNMELLLLLLQGPALSNALQSHVGSHGIVM